MCQPGPEPVEQQEHDTDSTPHNYKLVLAYDGTAYSGWQIQKETEQTIQGALVRAIERVVCHPVETVGAGRTDRGVHALGQVVSFETIRTIPAQNLLRAINSYLPDDIVVRELSEAAPDFSARFSALGKHYRYTYLLSDVRDVFARHWASRVSPELSIDAMKEAAGHLIGELDFDAFRTRSKGAPDNTVRTVYGVDVHAEGSFLHIDVVGRGFLYNMVRTIAGTLLEVGRGRLGPSSVKRILDSLDRREAGPTAEARGLCLVEVFYEAAQFEATIGKITGRGQRLEGARQIIDFDRRL